MAWKFRATAFESGRRIPMRFTCDGADLSPALAWEKPPDGTEAFALISDDPDAPGGTWVHWVIYDLPPTGREILEGLPRERVLTSGAAQGKNDFGKIGYNGPCPPPGPEHRYFFKLYALDRKTRLHAGATKAELEAAMEGHILDRAEITGTYGR